MTNRSLIHNKTTKKSIQMTKAKCYNEFHGKIYFFSIRQVFKLKTENQLASCSTNKNNQNKRKMTYQNPCKRYLIISSSIWSLKDSKTLENNFEKKMDSAFSIPPNILLLTIVLLVFLYLLSKLWQTQLEPNIRVIGKNLWNYMTYVHFSN